jgi:hypothetical protein
VRSCRAKHNVFVLGEPNRALCLFTMNPQNGAEQDTGVQQAHRLGGRSSVEAKSDNGTREELGRENESPLCLMFRPLTGFLFPIVLLCVQPHEVWLREVWCCEVTGDREKIGKGGRKV